MPGQGLPAEELPKFDLDFPGGYPGELVKAIQQALVQVDSDAYLNVVIPVEFQEVMLPPLKMRNVDVSHLFKALEFATAKQVSYPGGQMTTRYGFQTFGPITPRAIWYLSGQKPPESTTSTRIVRYYQLAPYLTEFTMDDIGSAIEAGWNMLGEKDTPKLNFHQDTKLLIAVGASHHLDMISSMLKELGLGMKGVPDQPGEPTNKQLRPLKN